MNARWLPFVLLSALSCASCGSGNVAAAPESSPETTSRFAITLDGAPIAGVRGVVGGAQGGEVVEVAPDYDPSYFPKKHLGASRHEPLVLEVALGGPDTLYRWIESAFGPTRAVRTLGVSVCDAPGMDRVFRDAVITEITFPALDTTDDGDASIIVQIQSSDFEFDPGSASSAPPPPAATPWQPSNFRIELGDLPCDRVTKIDAFTVRQEVATDSVGSQAAIPTPIEVGEIQLTISAQDADAWIAWFEDFVIDGNSGDAAELEGSITWFQADTKTPIGTIDLRGVGIVKLGARCDAGGEAQMEVQLYVEEAALTFRRDSR